MKGDPHDYIRVAAAVVELAVRDLTHSDEKRRQRARAWWLIERNPERLFWTSAAGVDDVAVRERLQERGLLDGDDA